MVNVRKRELRRIVKKHPAEYAMALILLSKYINKKQKRQYFKYLNSIKIEKPNGLIGGQT